MLFTNLKILNLKTYLPVLILLATLSALPFFVLGQWETVSHLGEDKIEAFVQIDDRYFIGSRSGIYASYDQGNSWERVLPNYGFNLICEDGNSLFASIYSFDDDLAIIYKSSDYGNSWQKLTEFTVNRPVYELIATDDYLLFSDYNIKRINKFDQNQDPILVENITGEPFKVNMQIDDETIWLQEEFRLKKSDDQGSTWELVFETQFFSPMNDFIVIDNRVILIRHGSQSLISDDYGENFEFYDFPNPEGFISASDGWLFSSGGYEKYHYSTDEGDTWTPFFYDFFWFEEAQILKNGSNILIGSQHVFESNDLTASWTVNAMGLGFDNFNMANSFKKIQSIGDLLYTTVRFTYFSENDAVSWNTRPNISNDLGSINVFSDIINFKGLYLGLESGGSTLFVSNGDILNWEELNKFEDENYFPVNLMSIKDTIIAVDGFGKISVSTNGADWTGSTNVLSNFEDMVVHKDSLYYINTFRELYISGDYGTNWKNIGTGLPESFAPSKDNLFSTDNHLFYYDSRPGPHLFISEDNGRNFTSINDNLTDINGAKILIKDVHVLDSTVIAVADSSIYLTADLGQNWFEITDNLFPEKRIFYDATIHNEHIFLTMSSKFDSIPYLWKRSIDDLTFAQVAGQVFHDENNNGFKDFNESNIANELIQFGFSNATVSDKDGYYSLNVELSSDTLRLAPSIPYAIVNPNYYLISESTSDLDFGIFFPPGHHDLSVDLTELNPFRPGFKNYLSINYANKGTEIANGTIKFLADPKTMFLSSKPDPDLVIGDTIYWNLTNLNILEDGHIIIEIQNPTSLNIDDPILCQAWINNSENDEDLSNNYKNLSTLVVGSYDPNDKLVAPEFYSNLDYQNCDTLTYTVRFQNTGNFPASFVTILDTLDQNLDLTSLEMISSSHQYRWTLRSNILRVFFDDINLPGKKQNEIESQGYIKYSIKPKPGLDIDETISNTAHIIFDYNLPIVTNTVSNTISNPFEIISTSVELCEGDVWEGISYEESVILSDTISFPNFDSIYITNINVNPVYNIQIDTTVNVGEIINGVSILSDTTFTLTFTSVENCDSLVNYNCSILTNTEKVQVIVKVSSIMPNPVDNILSIQLDLSRKTLFEIELIDLFGRKIRNVQPQVPTLPGPKEYFVDVSKLQSGVYFIRISSDEEQVMHRVLVQH